ncbi:MAG: hypothetical protein M1817_004697 [Caeruleum heppii]|nr:MAG: hypothetical protein M1817_004697 [Caeruleum heppii]
MSLSSLAQDEPETAEVILAIQLEELKALHHHSDGQRREDTRDGMALALDVYREELQNFRSVLADFRLGQCIGTALDEAAVQAALDLAEQEAQSRDRLSRDISSDTGSVSSEASLNAEESSTANSEDDVYHSCAASAASNEADETCFGLPALQDATDQPLGRLHACVVCDQALTTHEVITTPCSHTYCMTCLLTLFETSMRQEDLFPPRCCRQTIPLEIAEPFLTRESTQQFREKTIEFATPDRTYCCNPNCSTFIPPTAISDGHATCPSCHDQTCSICKQHVHVGDCPQDPHMRQLLDLARTSGWQRCLDCGRMLELVTGCNHMTAEFCYVCGLRWKTCDCAQWDEARLLDRAHQMVARDPARAPAAAAGAGAREEHVRQIQDRLRARHGCNHRSWIRREGPRRCDECRQQLPLFAFECDRCHIWACQRCRLHRL